jgi:hypothetical protein
MVVSMVAYLVELKAAGLVALTVETKVGSLVYH